MREGADKIWILDRNTTEGCCFLKTYLEARISLKVHYFTIQVGRDLLESFEVIV